MLGCFGHVQGMIQTWFGHVSVWFGGHDLGMFWAWLWSWVGNDLYTIWTWVGYYLSRCCIYFGNDFDFVFYTIWTRFGCVLGMGWLWLRHDVGMMLASTCGWKHKTYTKMVSPCWIEPCTNLRSYWCFCMHHLNKITTLKTNTEQHIFQTLQSLEQWGSNSVRTTPPRRVELKGFSNMKIQRTVVLNGSPNPKSLEQWASNIFQTSTSLEQWGSKAIRTSNPLTSDA